MDLSEKYKKDKIECPKKLRNKGNSTFIVLFADLIIGFIA